MKNSVSTSRTSSGPPVRLRGRRSIVRPILFVAHLWAGLLLAGLVSFLGLTGSALVWPDAINRALFPGWYRVERAIAPEERVSPGLAARAVSERFADSTLARLDWPRQADGTYVVSFKAQGQERLGFVHPGTGEFLGSQAANRAPIEVITTWHRTLTLGDTGKLVVGVASALMAFMVLSGLYLWWPRVWSRAFSVSWGRGANMTGRQLHSVLGAVGALVLLVIAVTGTMWTWEEKYENALNSLARAEVPKEPSNKSTPVEGASPLDVDAQVERARAALPGARLISLRPGSKADDGFRVDLRFDGEAHLSGRSRVWLDRYSGEVLRVQNGLALSPGRGLVQGWRQKLHTGSWGGALTKPIYFAAGFLPLFLSLSGIAAWRARLRTRSQVSPLSGE